MKLQIDSRSRETLGRCALLSGLGPAARERLLRHAWLIELHAGALLFGEGDEPDHFYVVLSGACEVVKHHSSGEFDRVIARVEPGRSVGELPLIEPAPRSATVRAGEASRLAVFPLAAVSKELFGGEDAYPFLPMLQVLQSQMIGRLKALTEQTIDLLKLETEALEERQRVSTFIVHVIAVLCAFMYISQVLMGMKDSSTSSTAVTVPVMVLIAAFLVRPVLQLGLPAEAFGITRRGWARSLRDGVVFALPPMGVALALRWAWVHSAAGQGQPVFDLLHTLTVELGSQRDALISFVGFNLAYAFIVVPLQELIARGLLQGLLERFIASERRIALSILMSNVVFGAFHLHLGTAIALVTFALGLYLGWLYTRTRNLLGVWVCHGLVGAWGLTVVRVQALW